MGLTVSASTQTEFELVPEGTYIARCFKVIDLGTQTITNSYGMKQQHKVFISWELLDKDTKMQDGKPFAVSKTYTATLDERGHLRKDLEAWRGKKFTEDELDAFDLKNVLGSYCMVQVVHQEYNGKMYANINSLMSTKEKPTAVNPDVHFDTDKPNKEVFDALSDYFQNKIRACMEWELRGGLFDGEPVVAETKGETKAGNFKTSSTAPTQQQVQENLGRSLADSIDNGVPVNLDDEEINLDDIPF